MIRRPPRSTRTDTLFPSRRSSDLRRCRAPLTRRPQSMENEMSNDEDYVYDEESGEWLPASELAARRAAAAEVEVRDAVGNRLADGDSVVLVKDLEVKGAGKTLKVGTVLKSIRLTAAPDRKRPRLNSSQ